MEVSEIIKKKEEEKWRGILNYLIYLQRTFIRVFAKFFQIDLISDIILITYF